MFLAVLPHKGTCEIPYPLSSFLTREHGKFHVPYRLASQRNMANSMFLFAVPSKGHVNYHVRLLSASVRNMEIPINWYIM